MSGDPLDKLRELAEDVPDDLVADWRGTNHFELTSAHHHDHFWWVHGDDEPSECTVYGDRLGKMLDIVAEVSRLKAEGVL